MEEIERRLTAIEIAFARYMAGILRHVEGGTEIQSAIAEQFDELSMESLRRDDDNSTRLFLVLGCVTSLVEQIKEELEA